jgi:conserved domain protein
MIKIRLSDLLGNRKMTQAELARKTGIRPNTINALYHEYVRYINKSDLDKICEVLNCDISELMEYVPNK